MTALSSNRSETLSSGHVSSYFINAFAALTTWNDARITRLALSKLTARELDDIGLTHTDVANMSSRVTL